MLSSIYVEDIFLDFCKLVQFEKVPIQPHDWSVLINFENVLLEQKQITQNQANFLIKILKKYQTFAGLNGLDYESALSKPQWKQAFRVLDLTKKIFVEEDSDKCVWVCLKFPFQLKKEFEQEFTNDYGNFIWDPEKKVRKNRLYDCNLISLYEFSQKHNFEIDDSFMCAMAQVEEIWQSQEDLIPYSVFENGSIILKNATEDALRYFEEKRSVYNDENILLAKSMGFPFQGEIETLVDKISSTESTQFWIKNYEDYFDVITTIKGKVVIVLDRAADAHEWLKNFTAYAEKFYIPRNEIKVCFREEKGSNSGLNSWIKENGYGGKVEEGRILIFLQKPAKWLFKDLESVKIVTTTTLYPPPNPIARDFFNSQSCVIYLGDIKPSEKKDQQIVEL